MTYDDYEKQVIQQADTFVACEFVGRASYKRAERKTLAGAKRAARDMIGRRPADDLVNKGRPILVYAVRGTNQVVAATVYP